MRSLIPILALALLAGCADEPLPKNGAVPAFTLVDQTGHRFDSSELKGKVWLADFIYTSCPGPCRAISTNMAAIQTDLAAADDVRFVSFSMDPERDTPSVLSEYGRRFGAEAGRWLFLTGAKEAITELVSKGFMLARIEGTDEAVTHSTKIVLVDRAGNIRGFYEGIDPGERPKIVRDTKRLMRERVVFRTGLQDRQD